VVIHRELLRLSDRTAGRVRAAGMVGRTVTIKVRFADFTTITRSRTLRDPTDVSRDIYATARSLFDALGLQRARIRLVGVRMEGLLEGDGAPIQATLDEPEHGWRDADKAVDRASARFGAGGGAAGRPGPRPRGCTAFGGGRRGCGPRRGGSHGDGSTPPHRSRRRPPDRADEPDR
jgi:DNA polymerase-4